MSDIDWGRVAVLLDVIHKAAGAGPKYASITAKAAEALDAEMAGPEAEPPTTELPTPIEEPSDAA